MPLHVRYFESRDGAIELPPTDDIQPRKGWEVREANTLPELDRLRDRLVQSARDRHDREVQNDELVWAEQRKATLSSLIATARSSATSAYEKDFIDAYLRLRADKRAEYQKRYACDMAYFEMRELDKARTPDEFIGESV